MGLRDFLGLDAAARAQAARADFYAGCVDIAMRERDDAQRRVSSLLEQVRRLEEELASATLDLKEMTRRYTRDVCALRKEVLELRHPENVPLAFARPAVAGDAPAAQHELDLEEKAHVLMAAVALGGAPV